MSLECLLEYFSCQFEKAGKKYDILLIIHDHQVERLGILYHI